MRKLAMIAAVMMAALMASCAQKEAQQEVTNETEEQDAYTSATPKATDTMSPEDFVAYLDECGKYFLATMDNDQPRVRPFSFCAVIDGNVYFMTRKHKDVYKQLVKNPKVQIAAFPQEGRGWMRITCKLIEEDSQAIRTTFFEKYPRVAASHPADDPDYAFMKLQGITAVVGDKVYSVK